ncbi:MAG TPA: aldose epimerase family protein [Candidatus Tumulicola sp.]
MAPELENVRGERVTFSHDGAAIVEIFVLDGQGNIGNVAMAAGGSAGRVVGRFANRIAGGELPLDGKTYRLLTNEGTNTLHGGPDGFSKRAWAIEDGATDRSLTFRIESPDGDQGFPGAVTVRVTYTFGDDSALRIDYEATSDAPTVINLTNHAYFNLTGDSGASIENVQLQVESKEYLPVDSALIPTGEIVSVTGTDRDFRDVRAIGTMPYDVTYVLEGAGLRPAAQAFDARSGRSVSVETTEPAIQLYTGKPGAFALETEHYPDAPHHPNFPSTELTPDNPYRSTTIYRFSAS